MQLLLRVGCTPAGFGTLGYGRPVSTQAPYWLCLICELDLELAIGVCCNLQGLHLVNTSTGDKFDLPVKGLFYGIGHQPNSKLVAGQIELDEAGYVKVRWLAACRRCSCHWTSHW
jgi:hypothetical protein